MKSTNTHTHLHIHTYKYVLQRAIELPMKQIFILLLFVHGVQYQKLSVYGVSGKRQKNFGSREIRNSSSKTLLANIQNRDSKNENILHVYIRATDTNERNVRTKKLFDMSKNVCDVSWCYYGQCCCWLNQEIAHEHMIFFAEMVQINYSVDYMKPKC